jgi:hypothetical protein
VNPELQKQLADMLAKLTDATTNAATWASGQLPSLVQEKILYGRIEETVGLLLFTSLCVYMARACQRAVNEAKEANTGDEIVAGFRSGITGFAAVVSFFFAIYQCDAAVMAWVAPRLYIVEWLKSMVTK